MTFRVLTQPANRFFLCNAKRDNVSNRPTLPWGPGRRLLRWCPFGATPWS